MKKTDGKEILELVKSHKMTAEEAVQLLRGKNEENARIFSYTTEWKVCQADTEKVSVLKNKIAVISDDSEIRKYLEELGETEKYRFFGDDSQIDASEEYGAFVFVHTGTDGEINDKKSILGIFNLTRKVIQRKDAVEIIFLYSNQTGHALPACAAVAGFFRTLKNENPKIHSRTVEFQNKDELLKNFSVEVKTHRSAASEVRYSNGKKFVKEVVRCELPSAVESIYHKNGVYLITGGAGGLGKLLAAHLAEHYNAHVFVTGRSELSEEKNSEFAQLCEKYPSIEYVKADVACKEDLRKLVEKIKLRHARIHGVFHVAGVYHNGFILKKSQEEFETTLLPKVDGVVNLDDCLQDEKLDFFVIFSSLAGVTGKIGQSDYTCANAFQDEFALYREQLRERGQRYGRTVSLDWPLWEEGGMTLSAEEQKALAQASGAEALPTKLGLECIESAVLSSNTQMAIIYAQKDAFAGAGEENKMVKAVEEEAEMDLKKLTARTKKYVRELICKGIGIEEEKLEDDVNLDEYGVDSIIVNMVNSELEKEIGEVTKTILYECQTIEGIADYLVENHRDGLIAHFGGDFGKKSKPLAVKKTGEHKKQAMTVVSEVRTCDEIAIIGVSGRYPQADNLSDFWKNLCEGRDCVTEVPGERWSLKEYYSPEVDKLPEGKMYCKWGGFLDGAFDFDPLLFNISPVEAEMMDPQERLFLEVSWEAMEDAGYTRKSIRELVDKKKTADVGVFVGVTSTTYQMFGPSEWLKNHYVMPNSSEWSVANRVSYVYNLQGPSITVDTACSSALSAVHLACESIRNNESSICIVGGVNIYSHPYKYVLMSQMKMLSPTGRCHSFGNDGDGFVPGEGAGALILKARADAERDGDHIYAIIKATAVNHDGKTNGYMVPSPVAQSKVILEALKRANVDPRTIGYVEAHGTGTKLGDPIEISALTKAYENYTSEKGYCAIGSVKSNIGHLEAAAGVAAITKVLLQMKNQKLVPTIHCEKTNSNINFIATPFFLERKTEEWKHFVNEQDNSVIPYRAGISSFGAGGSNAHVIMEEYCEEEREKQTQAEEYCVPISANSKETLQRYIRRIIAFLDTARKNVKSTLPNIFEAVFGKIWEKLNSGCFIEEEDILRYLEATKTLEAFDSALLLSKFQESGVFENPGEEWSEEEIYEKIGFIPLYKRLLHAQLCILNDNGYVAFDEKSVFATEKVKSAAYLNLKNNFALKKEQFLENYPELSAYAKLLWICIDAYPEVWTGKVGYQEVMFSGGSMELVKGIYRGNTCVDYFNIVLANAIKEYVAKRVEKDPGVIVHILEVGAGTGGTSAFVFKELAGYGNNVRYIYTDISAGFTQFGKKEFGKDYNFIDFKVLDIENDLESQGYKAGSVDIVLGCNVFHATKSIVKTMRNVRKLLKENGLVLINEVTEKTPSATLTFGLTNGWWLYEDEGIRIEDSPLLSKESWGKVLNGAGFGETGYWGFAQALKVDSWQHVIVGRAQGSDEQAPLDDVIRLKDVSYTFSIGREEMEERVAFVAGSMDQLYLQMVKFADTEKAVSDEIYVGNAKSNNITALLGSDLSQELSEMVLTKLDIRNAAKLWVAGIRVNWAQLFSGEDGNRISLPFYPFDHRKYKIQAVNTSARNDKWIDSVDYKESINSGIVFVKTWENESCEDEFVEAFVNVPELMTLEMVLEANERMEGDKRCCLEQLRFSGQVVEVGNVVTLHLRANNESDSIMYALEMASGDTDIDFLTLKTAEKAEGKQTVSLAGLLSSFEKCGESVLAALEYNRAQVIQELWRNDKKRIARVKADGFKADGVSIQPKLGLAIMSILSDYGRHGLFRPVSIEKFEFYKEISDECWLYSEQIDKDTYHVALIDEEGSVCVKFSNIYLEEKHSRADGMTYSPIWKQQEMKELFGSDAIAENVVVVYGREGKKLAEKINQKFGHSAFMMYVGEKRHTVEEYKLLFDKMQGECVVYMLGGMIDAPAGNEDLKLLARAQQEGIIEIYRMVKGLDKSSYSAEVTMLCLTDSVNAIAKDEKINIYAAGINGFVRNVVKEYSNLKAYTIDVDADELERDAEVLDQVVRGFDAKNGEEIVFRNHKCYLRTMIRTKLPLTGKSKFRENGVYLIVGGLGSIGYDFACHLAAKYHASIALTGLSSLDDRRKTQIAHMEALGGKVEYYQVDASDRDAMSKVAEDVQNKFGQVNGIIHSAMNFKEEMIQDVEEEILLGTLRPKMQGTMILHQLFSGYDFMIFFSSGQSYTGNAKRAHYAAACNFEDCYARMLSEKKGENVKVINWGFWGELKGQPITQEYRDYLEEAGVTPIAPDDGVEAAERFLNSDIPQICTYSVKDFVLKLMGAELGYYIDADDDSEELHVAMPRPEEQPVLSEGGESFFALKLLSHIMLLGVFRKMGVFLKQGEQYVKEILFRKLGIIEEYRRLYEALLLIMEQAGFITIQKEELTTTMSVEDESVLRQVGAIPEKMASLVDEMPEIQAYLRLLSVCIDHYPEILTGVTKATDVMFPNSSMELVGPIYKGNAGVDYFNRIVADSVYRYIIEKHRKVRILEIGAGTGGTSTIVLQKVAELSDLVSYTYTDISKAFIQHGKREYGSRYDFMEFKTLDIEQDVLEQGFERRSYDIVICANVLHATKDIAKTVRYVKQLMKKNAWLILNEAVQVQEFTTLTFGLTFGWWLYDDPYNRMPGSPLLSKTLWKSILSEEGFGEIVALGETGTEQGAIQNVIIAESNGCIRIENAKKRDSLPVVKKKVKEVPVKAVERPEREEKNENGKVASEKMDTGVKKTPEVRVREAIEQVVSELLQMGADMIDYDKAFMDYGVDSIMAAKITTSLNELLGIELQPSDLFDYPSINDLTSHIAGHFTLNDEIAEESIEPKGVDVLFAETDRNGSRTEKTEIPEDADEDAEMLKILQMVENKEIGVGDAEVFLEGMVNE